MFSNKNIVGSHCIHDIVNTHICCHVGYGLVNQKVNNCSNAIEHKIS